MIILSYRCFFTGLFLSDFSVTVPVLTDIKPLIYQGFSLTDRSPTPDPKGSVG
jgi:hypothetical protein